MIFPRATKDNQQNHKELEHKHDQISGTGLSQTGPGFSLLIVVVKNKYTQINIIFLIIHLSCTLNFSMMNLEKNYLSVLGDSFS